MKYSVGEAKAWVREDLRGYLTTTTTPFGPDGSVDDFALRDNVKRLLKFDAITGLYVGSIYQEPAALTIAERKRVTEIVIEAAGPDVPIVAGASANNVSDAVELAQHAQEAGADLVMVWAPTFGWRDDEGVYEFLRSVATAIDIGVCLYSTTLSEFGYFLTPATVSRLGDLTNVVAVKEVSLSAAGYLDMVRTAGDKVAVSNPLEEYWTYGRVLKLPGAANFILGSSRPLYLETGRRQLLSEFLDCMERGNVEAIAHTLQEILEVADQLHNIFLSSRGHNVAITKGILELMGLHGGDVRPPLVRATEADIAPARRILIDNGLLSE